MRRLPSDFEFTLESEIKYHKGPEEITSFSLLMKAPGVVHAKWCNKLIKGFFSGAQKMSDNNKDKVVAPSAPSPAATESESDIDANAIIMAITVGCDDMDGVFDAFKQLVCFSTSSVCLIDNTQPMMESIYSKLSYNDTKRLIGEYIKNFLIPSV